MQEFFKAPFKAREARNGSPGGGAIGSRCRFAAVLALTALVGACSAVPDVVNPVEWYKGARDYLSSGDKDPAGGMAEAKERAKPAPGADQPFPKLSTVPQRPVTSSREERQALARGLVSDPQPTRQYSTEIVRRQGAASNPLPDTLRPLAVARAPVRAPATLALPKPPATLALPKPKVTITAGLEPSAPAPAPAPAQALALAKAPVAPSVKPPAARRTLKVARMTSIPAIFPPLDVASLGTVIISASGVQTVGATGGAIVRPLVAPSAPPRAASTSRKLPSLASTAWPDPRPAPGFPAGMQGSYQVATILFDNGSARLKSNDRRILRQVAAQHRQTGGVIRIVGHASSRTRSMEVIRHKMINFEVSVARAESVANALLGMGTKAENMVIAAAADREPKYFEFMPSGEAGNRRTEIFIEY